MENQYKLYTDGSYLRKDVLSGYGGHIIAPNGDTVLEFSEQILNPALFNEFESLGMKRGLELCLENGIKNVICYTDEQNLSKIYNIQTSNLAEIYAKTTTLKEILALKKQFETISFEYVPRSKNKKADKLARKAIQTILEQSPQNDKFFHSDKLDLSSKYKNKEHFILKNKTFTDFIVIDTNRSNSELKAYYAKKDLLTNHIDVELIYSQISLNQTLPDIFNCLTKALEQKASLDKCVFCFSGAPGVMIESMLRGVAPVSKKAKPFLDSLVNTLEQFEEITYHIDTKIMDAIFNPVPIEKHTKETYFSAMKELGEDTYFIGKNKKIESLVPIKASKKDDINSIQKLCFHEFFKLHLKEITPSSSIKVHPNEKKQQILDAIKNLKDDLTTQGIKFRI